MGYRNKLMAPRGPAHSPNEGELRGSGRSTGLALGYLGEAIRQPGKTVVVVDHHTTRIANAYLLSQMEDIAKKLGLTCLTFYRGEFMSVRFDVLEWVD